MSNPQLLSIQVGLPDTHGADSISKQSWKSGIFKAPVEGKVWLAKLNLAGDGQADLRVHGGPYRAVLAYNAGRYPAWREELNIPELPYGAFGENFTVSELTEENVCIGDIYQVGEVTLQVAQPRQPCWKLARRVGVKDLSARVQQRRNGGWYHRVLQEGYVEAGLPITLIERPNPSFTIDRVFALMDEVIQDAPLAAALAECEALSPGWRKGFAEMAAKSFLFGKP
jgi:MOSC domain-containing protein YiiM